MNTVTRSDFERIVEPLDSDIPRNRKGRQTFFLASMVAIPLCTAVLGTGLTAQFFSNFPLAWKVGGAVSLGAGIALDAYWAEKFYIIRNSTTGLFVTQNFLASIFNLPGVNVIYGPGVHFSYPFERRLKENNISLLEQSVKFDGIVVQCLDGVLTLKGSYRARPRSIQAVRFLTGVASATDDVTSLIAADIINQLSGKRVDEALAQFDQLNEHLKHYSRSGDNDKEALENRFGIEIGDVTIDEMLESDEVRRTRSAISEASAITKGTWILLGIDVNLKDPAAALKRKIKAGELTQADVNLARDRFLSISGNLEGMQIDRNEYDISFHGLDPEAIKAITELAKTPAAQAYAAGAGRRSGGKSNKKPQNKGTEK